MALYFQREAGLSKQVAFILLILNNKTTDHKEKISIGFACDHTRRNYENGRMDHCNAALKIIQMHFLLNEV